MALLHLNPKFIETAQITAGARAAQAVAQRLSPRTIQNVQRLLKAGDFIDGLLGLSGQFEDMPTPLLGGLTPSQASVLQAQLREARLTRKNLFYVRITDDHMPNVGYSFAPGTGPTSTMDLFVLDVSYSPGAITSDKIQLGAAVMDRVNGTESVELQLTTMDDERGTMKRWFDAKRAQAVHPDGTFGLPSEYWFDIEVVHAVPQDAPGAENAYSAHYRMRAQTIQHEMSRRDQAVQELQMTFSQVDSFLKVN